MHALVANDMLRAVFIVQLFASVTSAAKTAHDKSVATFAPFRRLLEELPIEVRLAPRTVR
jgi:hypothetical protein